MRIQLMSLRRLTHSGVLYNFRISGHFLFINKLFHEADYSSGVIIKPGITTWK